MSTAIQFRRGTTTQHASFTGLSGEITIDTTRSVPVIHDGVTAGGHPILSGDPATFTTQTSLADTDYVLGSSGGGVKVLWSNIKAAMWTAWGGLIAGGTSKATPTSADLMAISDQAASGATKMVSIGNVFAQLGTFIAAYTAKTTPVGGDGIAVADSAASNAIKLVTLTNLWNATWTALGGLIAGGTAKATPTTSDILPISDQAASSATKKITISSLFSTLWTAWGGFIAGGTSKATPTTSDLFAISDQDASSATKMLSIGNLFSILGAYIAALTGKTTPVGADGIIVADSAASNANKLVTLTNLFAAWTATAANWRANANSLFLTVSAIWSAMAPVALTYGTTVSWDLSTGFDFTLTLTGNATLAFPTNGKQGQRGRIRVLQDATGSRTLGIASGNKTAGGTGITLSTAANAIDYLYYDYVSGTECLLSLTKAWS